MLLYERIESVNESVLGTIGKIAAAIIVGPIILTGGMLVAMGVWGGITSVSDKLKAKKIAPALADYIKNNHTPETTGKYDYSDIVPNMAKYNLFTPEALFDFIAKNGDRRIKQTIIKDTESLLVDYKPNMEETSDDKYWSDLKKIISDLQETLKGDTHQVIWYDVSFKGSPAVMLMNKKGAITTYLTCDETYKGTESFTKFITGNTIELYDELKKLNKIK